MIYKIIVENKGYSNWIKPSLNDEYEEMERTSEHLGIPLEDLVDAFNKGKLVTLTDDIWDNLDNYTEVNSMDDIESILTGENQRDYKRIVMGFENNESIPAPIVMKQGDYYYLVGGNTRLMLSKVLGIRPKIYVLEVE
jgi:hypothetical protein